MPASAILRAISSMSFGASSISPSSFWIAFIRSEEHTSELQSLMRNSYAVFCLKKKKSNLTIYLSIHYNLSIIYIHAKCQYYTNYSPHNATLHHPLIILTVQL